MNDCPCCEAIGGCGCRIENVEGYEHLEGRTVSRSVTGLWCAVHQKVCDS